MIPDALIAGSLAGLYCGPAPDPGAIWGRWNLDPLLLAALAALALGIGCALPLYLFIRSRRIV
mgnify:CR=1 FL=1